MPRYLSAEWVQAFNDALAGLDLTDAVTAAGAGSFTASQGTFAVAQVVTGVPPGIAASIDGVASGDATTSGDAVRLVLSVAEGRAALAADPAGSLPSNVTMVLTYVDAIAIARGELDPAAALAAGRVRIRGELAVLVAGQAMLNAAAAALGRTLTDLTDLDDTADPGE
jgi:hypothetical protein